MPDRIFLKQAAVKRLDAMAHRHPLGHQPIKANRYLLCTRRAGDIEIMLEKSDESPVNIWLAERHIDGLYLGEVSKKLSPASKLWCKPGKNGKLLYGRHSALEKMRELGNADLVCFAPKTLTELDVVLNRLGAL